MRRILPVLVLFAACASTRGYDDPSQWTRQDTLQANFKRDSYECESDARKQNYGDVLFMQFYRKCMGARGWNLKSDVDSTGTHL